ncbi:hypothetical protein EBO15_27840 [Actinomadura harenae]|uniref:Uncharacterized protein n=2 Tax=Actinomadura harenae TaxID=2483351 RepID=A0A3M2LS07_9ACTN|nr:hypothetical protein EBO15_27840 [Actinomadura harenae]
MERLRHCLLGLGWDVVRRYEDERPLLRVLSPVSTCIGDSVVIDGGWFRSGTGVWLAPCREADRAAEAVAQLLAPYVIAIVMARQQEDE